MSVLSKCSVLFMLALLGLAGAACADVDERAEAYDPEVVAGSQAALSGWRKVSWSMESSHPYTNSLATWKELTLPSDATKMRLVINGRFELEAGYDFVEVWAWQNGAWTQVKKYTGTVGPLPTDEFAGRYFYLKFVTDSSVTKYGFSLTAESFGPCASGNPLVCI
jgi:hypothetical protein